MGGFDHKPAEAEKFDPATNSRNARYGLALFFFYLLFYGAFVAINAFQPELLDVVYSGVNLGLWSGLGLIGGAVVLAVIYVWLCRAPVAEKEQH